MINWDRVLTALKDFIAAFSVKETPAPPEPVPPPLNPVTQVKPSTPMTNAEKVYATAKGLIGQKLAANNAADNYGVYGCAESVNAVWMKTFGRPIGGGASTALMLVALENKDRFDEVPFAQAGPGDVVIAATGTSTKYPQAHGHTGILGQTWIMSNSSETTEWTANYTPDMWEKYFDNIMGFKTRCFRVRG